MQEHNRVAGTDTDVGHATVKYVDVFLAQRGGTALLMFADHDTFFELVKVGWWAQPIRRSVRMPMRYEALLDPKAYRSARSPHPGCFFGYKMWTLAPQ